MSTNMNSAELIMVKEFINTLERMAIALEKLVVIVGMPEEELTGLDMADVD